MASQQSPNLLKYQYLYMTKFFLLFSFAEDRNTDTEDKTTNALFRNFSQNVYSHSHTAQPKWKYVGESTGVKSDSNLNLRLKYFNFANDHLNILLKPLPGAHVNEWS